MNALTRCEALPKQVQDDLTLVLFWCEHYAQRAEQDAVERLVDYFAEPFEEPDHYPHLDAAQARIAELIEANTACTLHIASQNERINRFVELVDQLERQLAERDASFNLRWNADMEAIQRWQEATGEELKWPNHVDLCVWLMQQLAAKDARIESLEQANRDLRMELSAYQAAHNRTLPSGDTRQRRKPTND